MNTPLTKDEADYAEKHHSLVYAFLRRKGYSFDDFYDIAIFGYLRAVRNWYERGDLRDNYQFSTIAFMAMRKAIANHFRDMNRLKRSVSQCRFIDQCGARTAEHAEVAEIALVNESVRKALSMLSPRQRDVARLIAAGLNNREIGERYGVTHERIRQEMVNARARIMRSSAYVPELMAA